MPKKQGFWILAVSLTACVLTVLGSLTMLLVNNKNNFDSFDEPYVTLDSGWTIYDSEGNSKEIDKFPYILDYGKDGNYTIEAVLHSEDGLILSPVLELYSNYLDITVELDGERIYNFPNDSENYPASTGNTWHYIRLADYNGKNLKINLHCQLGDGITYQLDAPKLGAKATILNRAVLQSFPAIIAAGCMLVLSVMLFFFYFALRRKLRLDYSSIYIATFSMIFAVYVFLESSYIKIVSSNSYAVYTTTFMALALLTVPLICFFANHIEQRYRPISVAVTLLCLGNFFVQSLLHFTRISDFRVMMPATHAVIIISILTMAILLFISKRESCPQAKKMLLSVTPVIIGGSVDIVLLWINRPSFNNSLWFVIGVSIFVISQFFSFVKTYFGMYRMAVENDFLRSMAFRDELTGLGNRNAYEEHLKSLSGAPSLDGFGCIVADINRLKMINDTYGHQAGDAVIKAAGEVISEIMPSGSACYRTGGDEFVVIMHNRTAEDIEDLSRTLYEKVDIRGEALSLPLSISAGHGCFEREDKNIIDFIKRIDSLMYTEKEILHKKLGYKR